MISGGNATIFVSNMDRAVDFYCNQLGLRLAERYGDNWATVDAGKGFTLGLHPPSPFSGTPGLRGGVMVGLEVSEPIEQVVATLQARGVRLHGEIIKGQGGTFAHILDPDDNLIYLWQM